MTADPDGSSTVQGRLRGSDEPRQGACLRGPGWRVFDACPNHGKQVRDWITGVVIRHGCQADPGDAALVVSELFANALMHGLAGGKVLVGYCLWPGGARIVVCNECGVTTPRLRGSGELDGRGRGLQVVNAIAARRRSTCSARSAAARGRTTLRPARPGVGSAGRARRLGQ